MQHHHVRVDELRLHLDAVQREMVAVLHVGDRALLLYACIGDCTVLETSRNEMAGKCSHILTASILCSKCSTDPVYNMRASGMTSMIRNKTTIEIIVMETVHLDS